jgi:hypothetical protein
MSLTIHSLHQALPSYGVTPTSIAPAARSPGVQDDVGSGCTFDPPEGPVPWAHPVAMTASTRVAKTRSLRGRVFTTHLPHLDQLQVNIEPAGDETEDAVETIMSVEEGHEYAGDVNLGVAVVSLAMKTER